jgi:hypothetical protein
LNSNIKDFLNYLFSQKDSKWIRQIIWNKMSEFSRV